MRKIDRNGNKHNTETCQSGRYWEYVPDIFICRSCPMLSCKYNPNNNRKKSYSNI